MSGSPINPVCLVPLTKRQLECLTVALLAYEVCNDAQKQTVAAATGFARLHVQEVADLYVTCDRLRRAAPE